MQEQRPVVLVNKAFQALYVNVYNNSKLAQYINMTVVERLKKITQSVDNYTKLPLDIHKNYMFTVLIPELHSSQVHLFFRL